MIQYDCDSTISLITMPELELLPITLNYFELLLTLVLFLRFFDNLVGIYVAI